VGGYFSVPNGDAKIVNNISCLFLSRSQLVHMLRISHWGELFNLLIDFIFILFYLCSIFLVDHAWTFQSKWAQRQLEVISGLAERIGALMGLIETSEQEKQEAAASESDTYDADSESGEEVLVWCQM